MMAQKEKLYYLGENPAVDIINFIPSADGKSYDILLISRGGVTNHNRLALIGGFIDSFTKRGELFQAKESPEEAAARELEEETLLKVSPNNLLLVGYYNHKNRDPRNDESSFVSSTVFAHFWTLENWEQQKLVMKPSDGEKEIHLFPLDAILKHQYSLAFDHQQIIEDACLKFFSQKQFKP